MISEEAFGDQKVSPIGTHNLYVSCSTSQEPTHGVRSDRMAKNREVEGDSEEDFDAENAEEDEDDEDYDATAAKKKQKRKSAFVDDAAEDDDEAVSRPPDTLM